MSRGSDTARNSLERICEETQTRFRVAAESNEAQLREIEKARKLKKEVKERRDSLSSDLTIDALDRNEKEMEKLEKYFTLADKREKFAKAALTDHYRKHYSNSKEDEKKSVTYLVPKGIEKGKGAELAKTAPLWLKQNVTSFPTTFRFVDRTCKEFDSEKAVFWKPPLLKDGLKEVPLIERDSYRQETKDLWDLLATGKLEAEPFSKLTQPCMRGKFGNVSVEGEVDNGVLAIWVLLMRYRKCDDAHTTHLIKTLSQSENLFRAPKANIQKSVDSLGKVLKECVTLGVKVPWVTTGREVVKVLKTQGFTEYVHKFMNGGPDPEDSAKHFQSLLSTVERVAKDVEETEGKKGGNRKSYWAHEAHLYDLNYDASINSHCITASPNPHYDPENDDVTDGYSAYDTNYAPLSNWSDQYDSNDHIGGNGEEYYDCYDGAADNVWDENPSDYIDFQAYESRVYDHRSKGSKGSKGKSKGKSKKGGSASHGGKARKGFGKGKVGDNSKGGNSKPCFAMNCNEQCGINYTFCNSCHQRLRDEGFIVKKDGKKIVDKYNKSTTNDKFNPLKRALECQMESNNPDAFTPNQLESVNKLLTSITHNNNASSQPSLHANSTQVGSAEQDYGSPSELLRAMGLDMAQK